MFVTGIALEPMMKLFSNGTTSHKLCKHIDGHFN